MWGFRLPVVLSLLGYGLTMFLYLRKHLKDLEAFAASMLLVTCGRIWFYDSFLGLIDTTFSWVVFTSFMVIYHEYKRGNIYRLFLISYFLCALGFLMKGLPALLFQATTLLVLFISEKKFWKLVSIPHTLGILLLFSVLGMYYYAYFQVNEGAYQSVFETIFTESSKRTVVRFGLWASVLHFITFPFEMLYHFAPWTVLVIFLIRRDVFSQIWDNHFIRYCALAFLFNILPYWSSPEVFPRYLLMHTPLIFIVYVYFYFRTPKESWQHKAVYVFFLLLGLLTVAFHLVVGSFVAFGPFGLSEALASLHAKTTVIQFPMLKGGIIALAVAFALWLFVKIKAQRLVIFILIIVLVRIGFDFFILPPRVFDRAPIVEAAYKVAEITEGNPLYIYKGNRFYLSDKVEEATSFYIEKERGEVLPIKRKGFNTEDFYLITGRNLEGKAHQKYLTLPTFKPGVKGYLVKFE